MTDVTVIEETVCVVIESDDAATVVVESVAETDVVVITNVPTMEEIVAEIDLVNQLATKASLSGASFTGNTSVLDGQVLSARSSGADTAVELYGSGDGAHVSATNNAGDVSSTLNLRGDPIKLKIGTSTVAEVTNTGLAVTGGLTATGNVGIGAATNSYKLNVLTTGAAGLRLETSGSSFANPAINLADGVNGTDAVLATTFSGFELGTYSSSDVLFKRNQLEKFRITSTGATVTGDLTATAIKFSGGLPNHVDDVAAAAGGIPVNGLYRNGSVVMIRVS